MDLQACQVVELDSCAEEKFSRHLIIRLPGLAFCTNAHVGAFVRQVVAGLPQGPATGDCSALIGPAAGQQGITQSTLKPATASGRWTNVDRMAQATQDKETAPSSAGASQQSSELATAEPMLPLPGKGCGVLQAEVGPADWAARTAAFLLIPLWRTLALMLAQQLDAAVPLSDCLAAKLASCDVCRMDRTMRKRLSWWLLWRASLCQEPTAGEQHVMSACWC